ncbi:MAG TPA: EamA family transporter [Patescibacteria group bacterium]
MWLIYSLLAPFLNSVDSLGEKFLTDKHIENAIVIVINEGLIYTLFGIVILFFHSPSSLSLLQIIALLLSGMFFIYYLIPYFKALKKEETSRVIPLFQFIPIFVLIMSFLLLGEKISLKQSLGFVFIFLAAFSLTIEKLEGKIFKPRKAFWYMILSSFLYALSPILFKLVVVNTDFWTAFFYQAVGGGIGALSLLSIPSYRHSTKNEGFRINIKVWLLMSTNQILAIMAEFFSSLAFSLAPVALVSVITGTQPVFVLILAIILSKWFPHIVEESLQKKHILAKAIAIFIIICGICLIYL